MTLHAIITKLPHWKKLIDCQHVMIQLQLNHHTLVKIASSLPGEFFR